ncbi:methionine--tRNA ligase [Candidatus Mycoplasma pogonae]
MNNKNKTFYVTTPIYYPSGDLHIGHLYSTTIAWVLRNYKKMQGYDTYFSTGSDDHGQKIAQKAAANNMTNQDYVDQQVAKFYNLWQKSAIDYDVFIRTTDEKHKKVIQNVFQKMLDLGLIYKGLYRGLYSVSDEEFLTPTQANFVEGKYYHPVSGHELIEISEESYFLKMSQFSKWWQKTLAEDKKINIPQKIINDLKNNFIDKGLEDLSITRISFDWGIKVPNDPKHVVYVWIDALFNYLSLLGFSLPGDNLYQKYWKHGDEIVHVVGKEITRFHCIYWPIMLEAIGERLPSTILSHGWIITPQGKMSKSKGNTIDPLQLLAKYDSEILKYFFVSKIGIFDDGIFDEALLVTATNTDLANNFGNLLSRTTAMIEQNFLTQPVQYLPKKFTELENDVYSAIATKFNNYQKEFDNFQIHNAFKEVMNLGNDLNGYIDKTKPWTLKNDLERLEVVLNTLLNGIYAMAAMLKPVLIHNMAKVAKQLNVQDLEFNQINDYHKFDHTIIKKGEIIFHRIK